MSKNALFVLAIFAAAACSGSVFAQAVPAWERALPRPVYDERPELVDFCYKAWEIAHGRIDVVPGLPAPRYMDEAHRSDRVWIWDTCFMTLFCKYCPWEFPGVESLENFYALMLDGGVDELPKVVGNRACGEAEGKLLEFKIHHPDNPPVFAWAEYSHALQTGDRARLEKVYLEKRWLQRWYELFDSFDPAAPRLPAGACPVALKKVEDGYRWAGNPSGMDNTPRGRAGDRDMGDPGVCPNNPDLLWLDALAQQGLSPSSTASKSKRRKNEDTECCFGCFGVWRCACGAGGRRAAGFGERQGTREHGVVPSLRLPLDGWAEGFASCIHCRRFNFRPVPGFRAEGPCGARKRKLLDFVLLRDEANLPEATRNLSRRGEVRRDPF